ncbi:MAG: hypothetical protein RLZZ543_1707 [Bacteroidota bacterium]
MTDSPFITFQKFNTEDEIHQAAKVLETAGIRYLIEVDQLSFDATFSKQDQLKEYLLKIQSSDFLSAQEHLDSQANTELDGIDESYFLFQFSDEELWDVLAKRDEWGQFNYLLAQKTLKERGHQIDPTHLKQLNEERITALSEPEKTQNKWIFRGYILAISGGIIGLFIGWHLATFKKTLPNGTRVHGYSLEDRKHGNRIFILGGLSFAVWVILLLNS